jgi:hypothetical protein
MQHVEHGLFLDAQNRRLVKGGRGRHAKRLAGETRFTKKTRRLQNRDHRFCDLLGHDGQLDLASLDLEDGIRCIPLRQNNVLLLGLDNCFAAADLGEKDLGNGVVGGCHYVLR